MQADDFEWEEGLQDLPEDVDFSSRVPQKIADSFAKTEAQYIEKTQGEADTENGPGSEIC
jgi:hypothetical protein